MTGARRTSWALWFAPWVGGSLLAGLGCGGPQSLGGAGDVCFRDDQCSPGFICVAPLESPSDRVCSSDATPLISTVTGPEVMEPSPNGGAAGGGAPPMAGGATSIAGSGAGAGVGGAVNGGSGGSGGVSSGGSSGDTQAGSGGSGGSGGTEPTAGSLGVGGA